MKATISALALTCLLFTAASAQQTIRPFLWQAGMARSDVGEINVFRRFPADRRAQVEAFYAEALGLTALPPTAPGGGQMIRYPLGASEVKLFPTEMAAPNVAAAGDIAGMRLLTFFYADEAALTKGSSPGACRRHGSSQRPVTAAPRARLSCRILPGTGSSSSSSLAHQPTRWRVSRSAWPSLTWIRAAPSIAT